MEFWNNGDKIVRSEIAGEYYDRFAKYRKNTLMKTFPDHDNAQLMWWVVTELKFLLIIYLKVVRCFGVAWYLFYSQNFTVLTYLVFLKENQNNMDGHRMDIGTFRESQTFTCTLW